MIQPIYHDLSEKLEVYIRDRGLSGRLPGLGPLSREFGVNPLTMSKAVRLLEEKGVVTINGTRGTFVNGTRPKRPVYKVIGLVGVTKLDERDYILDNLEPYAAKKGYHLLGITGSPELFARKMSLLTSFPVDGLIFCYSSLTTAIANYLHKEGIPILACNRRPDLPWLDTVDFDHDTLYQNVFNHLRKLGHHRIAVLAISASEEYRHHEKWVNAICRKYLGNDYNDELYYPLPYTASCPPEPEEIQVPLFRILDRAFSLREPPTAFIVPETYMEEFRKFLQARRIRVPEDVSLVTFGSGLSQEFTHASFDYRKIWEYGLQRMLELLDGRNPEPKKKLLKIPCLPGTSTGKVPDGNKKEFNQQIQSFNKGVK